MPRVNNKSPHRPWLPERKAQERRVDELFDYNSPRWRKDRRLHLQENPLCVECIKQGITTPATVSDHTRAIREGGDPWDWANRQPLCKGHHDRKSGREAHTRWGRGGKKPKEFT